MPLAIAILAGIGLGYACRGRLSGLGNVNVGHPAVILGLFVVQAIARGRYSEHGFGVWGLPVWGFASVALAVLTVVSRNRGLHLVGAGVLLNLLVVFANGKMPVALPHTSVELLEASQLAFYAPVSSATHLVWLGDILPFPSAQVSALLSAGDVLLMVGVAVTILEAMVGHEHTEADHMEVG